LSGPVSKSHTFVCFLVSAFVLNVAPLCWAEKLYAPALRVNDGSELRIALVNPTTASAEVTLTARTYDGSIIHSENAVNPVTVTVPPLAHTSYAAAELFGTGVLGQAGWVQLSTLTSELKGAYEIYDSKLSLINGAGFVARAARKIFFPKISAASDSPVSFVNTSSEAIDVSVSLYENNGRLAASETLSLAPFAGFFGRLSELTRSASFLEGYAIVESQDDLSGSTESLIGIETFSSQSGAAIVGAFSESTQLTKGFLTHFASLAGFSTTLTLLNPTAQSQRVRITAATLEQAGLTQIPDAITVERILLPNARLDEHVEEMFGFSGTGLETGYITYEVVDDTPGLMGLANFGTVGGTVTAVIEAQGQGYLDVGFEQWAPQDAYYAGMALLNGNSDPAILRLENFDANGRLRNTVSLTLAPGQRKAALLGELLRDESVRDTGYTHITATLPIFAAQLMGSKNSSTLTGVPALDLGDIFSNARVDNKAPTVSAGSNQVITLPASANLQGSATDDGKPSGTLTTTWSKFSGPGTVTFGNVKATSTTASFSTAGSYVLRLSASDGPLTSTSNVTITVNPTINQAPTVNAGSAQTVTLPASASLQGTASDDGKPSNDLV
jgi:hypothetical protein